MGASIYRAHCRVIFIGNYRAVFADFAIFLHTIPVIPQKLPAWQTKKFRLRILNLENSVSFDSKSEQLTSTTIQTDPHQRTYGPVPNQLLLRSPEVPDAWSVPC